MGQRVNGKPIAPAEIWESQDDNGCLIIPDQTDVGFFIFCEDSKSDLKFLGLVDGIYNESEVSATFAHVFGREGRYCRSVKVGVV
jgi:hypothetical protein